MLRALPFSHGTVTMKVQLTGGLLVNCLGYIQMTGLGQKRTSKRLHAMSALPPKVDIAEDPACQRLSPTCLAPATFPSDGQCGVWGMSDQQQQSLSFGVIDRPACPSCGELAFLTRRSPHPDHDLRYELQIFTCSACDHTIERIVDANGDPPEKLNCCD
jgi:hypothetical protein